ncbi:helix-turn-helix transcriptional regulator [Fusibacter sp. 3D3]|uniref:ArsR/SmtB family transcription factor n=1 Tax=Fusibacter sp. 3D3 TaxID=1048380 RepID=UPI00085337C6|nr:metalloregulator ArsR/SmtB family transcription factor [Fusibacter sp. 3D3]GAU76520.1 arsenical resistance operon repressor [Fusibacter sp. 3D3]
MSEQYELNVKIFKAFCDENRLKILELLQTGEKCGCTLQDELPICQSTLSHHMKILVESGVVEVRRDKKWSYYALSNQGAVAAGEKLKQLLTKKYSEQIQCICEVGV